MARVFIFRASGFPRGAASANYIQYLADALISSGNSVIVIGTGRNRADDQIGDSFVYEGIEYFNNKSFRFLAFSFHSFVTIFSS